MDFSEVLILGWQLSYLQLVSVNLPVVFGTSTSRGFWLLGSLEYVLQTLQREKLSLGLVKKVSEWIAKLSSKYEEGVRISKDDAKELGMVVKLWSQMITNELARRPIVEVKRKSGLDPFELQKVASMLPSEFISADLLKEMSEIERSDVADAAKCLMFDAATPAVMVALRGAEAALKSLYCKKTGESECKLTWGTITKRLRDNAKDFDLEESFIGYLDYYGQAKRNFAQHPNKIYSIREATSIFMQVIPLIEDVHAKM